MKNPAQPQRWFVLGQVATYCEQVAAGSKLAAEVGCSAELTEEVCGAIAAEDLLHAVRDRGDERVVIYIYKYPFVKELIDWILAQQQSKAAIWAAGKLFGYSDAEIARFLEQHALGTPAN